ncbi:MAG: GMC family oxidoreductase [Flavobacteriales bacterium]|jgi:cholesterol oxidase|nr:GMC family oxidoreductase [Flavobacteriales bacterium]
MAVEKDYDYIVIGSGFGGSVSALRLAQKGYRVLVIEKGKWYKGKDFAKTNWNLRKWLWLPRLRFFGIMKLSIFRHVAVISGAGVGGGSLVYANTLPVPKTNFYKTGTWSDLNDWESVLKPYYQKALTMLGASQNPKLFDGDKGLEELAQQIGRPQDFERPNVAVYFGEESKTVKDPYFNGEGPDRTGCNFCGGCMTGCRNNAKNTLDKNYLYLAQKLGVKIIAESEVIDVKPILDKNGKDGYIVQTKSSTKWLKKKREYTTKGVVFSGGVLGTIKLALKLKKQSLPLFSKTLGDNIRTNNETLISVSSLNKQQNFSKGVAIGSLLHTDENSHLEIVRYAEGSGFWRLLHLPLVTGKNTFVRLGKIALKLIKAPFSYIRVYWLSSWSKQTSVLLFMQTLDSTLKFDSGIFGGLKTSVSKGQKPTPNIPESVELAKRYSKIVNGKPTSFALETLAGIPSTAHILGGAVMGKTEKEGVINQYNEVFNYHNMYIIDGSMISANPGVNPSLSITAIAEHAMEHIEAKK